MIERAKEERKLTLEYIIDNGIVRSQILAVRAYNLVAIFNARIIDSS